MGKEKLIDLTGKSFGELTVLRRDIDKISKGTYWICRCSCGNEKSFFRGNLLRGSVKSCGCKKGEAIHLAKSLNLEGKRFGRLTAVSLAPYESGTEESARWKCLCDCGNEAIIVAKNLISGNTRSCGCLLPDILNERNKSNAVHNGSYDRLYCVWQGMKNRCYSVKNHAYKDYGGRGISVCDEWIGEGGYDRFKSWAYSNGYDENAPRGKCTLDRVDVNGNYEPSNCRWVSLLVQANNKRNIRMYELNGEEKPFSVWCREYDINPSLVRQRMKNYGWSFEKAVSTPPRKINKYE